MGATVTFDELENQTCSALTMTGQLRRKFQESSILSCLMWSLRQGARLLQDVANDVRQFDLESMSADDREYLTTMLERLHLKTSELLALSEEVGLMDRRWLRGWFRQIEESNQTIGDFLETYYLSCNDEFRGMVSEAIGSIKKRRTNSRDWRASLAEMQD